MFKAMNMNRMVIIKIEPIEEPVPGLQSLCERQLKQVRPDHNTMGPVQIGRRGWAAPFSKDSAATSLRQCHKYQCAGCLLWIHWLKNLLPGMNYRSTRNMGIQLWGVPGIREGGANRTLETHCRSEPGGDRKRGCE